MANNIVFSSNPSGSDLGYLDNDGTLREIPTNISNVSVELLKNRFYADIVKDALENPSVKNIIKILNSVWSGQVTISSNNYKILLDQCENALTLNPSIKNKETELKNILKTSTVGSNTKISMAQNAIWESGMGPEKICMRPNVQIWKTPASDLDTLPKGNPPGVKYWPQNDPNINSITFDSAWHRRLGFPNNVGWSWTKSNDVVIQYGNGLSISKADIDNQGGVNIYANANKNSTIDSVKNIDYERLLLLAKEYGDVAQVWMYFAFALPNPDSVMITTDSVVYFMCVLLNLSCVYTGGRKGVESGKCSLKHYQAGDIDLNQKLSVMLDMQFKRILEHNTAIKFGLNIMFIDLNKFEYFRQDGARVKRTYGSFQTDPAKKTAIQELINRKVAIIDSYNEQLQTYYKTVQSQIPPTVTNDIIDSIYNDFYNYSEGLKIQQWITKLPNKNYILNPGEFLTEFGSIVGVTVPGNLGEIKPANLDSSVQGGSKKNKKIYSFGSTKRGGGGYGNIGYYESVILIYTYGTIFNKFPDNHQEHKSNFGSNPNLDVLFALKYDMYSRNFEKTISNSDGMMFELYNKYDDDEILTYGFLLSEYIYFADDYDFEIQKLDNEVKLQTENNRITTRSMQQTIYSQPLSYSHCDNTRDPITGQLIKSGMGIVANKRCYDIRSFLKWYLSNPDAYNNGFDFYKKPITDPDTINNIQSAMAAYENGQLLLGGKKQMTRRTRKNKRKLKTLRNKEKN
jgi:hypothetical protein